MINFINAVKFNKSKKLEAHLFLEKYNVYYKNLSAKDKRTFALRVLSFLEDIEILVSKELKPSVGMNYLLAGAFIQLTFGFKRYRLKHFERIFLAHEAYAYKNSAVLYYGDTNLQTAQINMVWKVVKKGFEIPDDSVNLAIHEFAHALVLDNSKRSVFTKFYQERLLNNYFKVAEAEMHNIRTGGDSIFRDYGAVNLMEFFAVSVEVFFEQPQQFARHSKVLYEKMCMLLNQDPRKTNNPRFY